MKNEYVMSVVVLSAICLVMTGALSLVNNVIRPIIEQSAIERSQTMMMNIIPQAEGFELIDSSSLPAAVNEVFVTTNNTGYIFIVTTSGYGGNFRVICGIDPEGRIIRSVVLPPHSETPGLGTTVFDRASEYEGKDLNFEGVHAITGSTITFNAYRTALQNAFNAFHIVREMSRE